MSQPSQVEQKEARRKELSEVLSGLAKKSLLQEGFFVEELVEVYRTDVDGRRSSSVGFFRDENLAKAFAQNQNDSSYHKTERKVVLTDGHSIFRLELEYAPIFDSTQAALEIREKALAKLTAEERQLLNL